DAEQLKQVLINLVQNAIHAIGRKPGKILIKTLRPERFSDFRGAETVELQVSDSGPGIPIDQQLHIFVPFFTTKQKGTGLGLAICQRIVKNHGGTISVQSRIGEGASFLIRLPALPSEAPTTDTPVPGAAVPSARGRLEPAQASAESVAAVSPSDSTQKVKKKRRMASG